MKKQNFVVFAVLFVLTVNLFAVVSALEKTVDLGEYLVDYSYSDANAGEKFTLVVTITNIDNKNKSEVEFKLDFDSPFSKVTDKDWEIGELAKDASVSKSFRVEIDEDADSGNSELNFKIADDDDDYEDEFKIDINSDKAELILNDLSSEPKKLTPDQSEIKLIVKIENKGDKDAEYTKAKLILPEGFSSVNSYSDTITLGTIESGEEKEATFYISTSEDLSPANYKAKLNLNYESDGDDETQELELDLPVLSVPQFSITSASPSKVEAGKTNTLKITIQNTGEEKGESTSIRVFEKSSQPFDFDEKNSEIGTLDPYETGTATFDFTTDSDATNVKYLLEIQVRTISNGEVITYDKTVPITVTEKETNILVYILGGTAIFLGVIGYFIFKYRK